MGYFTNILVAACSTLVIDEVSHEGPPFSFLHCWQRWLISGLVGVATTSLVGGRLSGHYLCHLEVA